MNRFASIPTRSAIFVVVALAVTRLASAPIPAEEPKLKTELSGHLGTVWELGFSGDGKILVSGGGDKKVKIWDVGTGKCAATLEVGGHRKMGPVAISPDGKLLAYASGECFYLWDIEAGKQIGKQQQREFALSLAFSPDSKSLAIGSSGGCLELWDRTASKCLATFAGHKDNITSLVYSVDGQVVTSGGDKDVIAFWDVAERKCTRNLKASDAKALALSPDGKTLASARYDGTVELWNVADGKEIATFKDTNDMALAVAFSPDGKILAVGTRDREKQHTLLLIDVAARKQIAALQGNKDYVNAVAFNPKGNRSPA